MKVNTYGFYIKLFSAMQILGADCVLAEMETTTKKPLPVAFHLSQTGSNASSSSTLDISHGGTGKDTFTAYAVLAGGVTSQSPLQQVSGVGTSGQVLTSNGVSALPSWQNAGSGGITTLTGNGGSATGSTVAITGGPGIATSGSVSTLSININPPISVPNGGTGVITLPAYRLLAGGTALDGAIQQVANGTAGQGLSFVSSSALPTWSNFLPGVVAGTGFLFGGSRSGSATPSFTTIISNSSASYASMTIGATANTFIGANTGSSIIGGESNTAVGFSALVGCTNGISNVGIGSSSLTNCNTGSNNVGVGDSALLNCSNGSNNIGIGGTAGRFLNTSSTNNICIGNASGPGSSTTQSNYIYIGNASSANTYIFGIRDTAIAGDGIPVSIDSTGRLGTTVSSRKFKENIETVPSEVSEKILDLDVVQFNYISDESKSIQYGLIAEDVEPIFPEMIVYDKDGEINTVQYHKLLPLVIKELQAVVKNSEMMQSEIDDLKQENIALKNMVNELKR